MATANETVNMTAVLVKATKQSEKIARSMYGGTETINTVFAGILRSATCTYNEKEQNDEKAALNKRISGWKDEPDTLRNDLCANLPRSIRKNEEESKVKALWKDLSVENVVDSVMALEAILRNFRTPEINAILENSSDAAGSRKPAPAKTEEPKKADPSSDEKPEVSRKELNLRTESLLDTNSEVRARLLSKIDGQNDAINLFFNTICENDMQNLGENEFDAPRAVFTFIGAPNIGKTYLAAEAARAMRCMYLELDMTQYSSANSLESLLGSAANKNGILPRLVAKDKKSVIVVKNMESACMTVKDKFNEIITTGTLKTGMSELDFSKCIIIFVADVSDDALEVAAQYEDQNSTYTYDKLSKAGFPASVLKDKANLHTYFALNYAGFPVSVLNNSTQIFFENPTLTTMERVCRASMDEALQKLKKAFSMDIEVEDRVYSALLYNQPDGNDAEAIGTNAKKFVNNEMMKLLSLYDPVSAFNSINNLGKIRIVVDIKDEDPAIQNLFIMKEKIGVLFVGLTDRIPNRVLKALSEFEIYEADNSEEAVDIMNKNNIALVIMQIDSEIETVAEADPDKSNDIIDYRQYDKPQEEERNEKHTEVMFDRVPVGSTALVGRRRDLHVLCEKFPEVPVYINESGYFSIDQELRNALIREGAAGILSIATAYDEISEFVKELRGMGRNLYVQSQIRNLKSQSKILTFESTPLYGEKTNEVIIRLKNFALKQYVANQDSDVDVEAADHIDVRLSDVIGAESAKEELTTFLDYLKNPRRYIAGGMRAPRGILLYGKPGTGKTMLAKALAGEANVAFLALEGSAVIGRYVGDEQKTIKELFAKARKYAPSIVFIDEIDTIGKERSGGNNTMARVEEQALTTLLSEMDGAKTDPKHPVFVIAATNYGVGMNNDSFGRLDPALLRRFDRAIYVSLPDKAGRIKFLQSRTSNNKLFDVSRETIRAIASRTAGCSLADLDNVIESAKRKALRKDTDVTDEILNNALNEIIAGEKVDWGSDIMEHVAYHEAGHVIAEAKNGHMPSYVNIVTTGNALGTTEAHSSAISTKAELLGEIRSCLAGRAAEALHFGEDGVSNGCSGDLKDASRLAKEIICSFGMDEDFGLFTLTEADLSNPYYAEQVHKKALTILNEQMTEVTALLKKQRRLLDAIVDELLEKNQLNKEELEDLFDRKYEA